MESARHTADAELALQRADFLAEDELIEISPMVKSGKVVLVCGNFGPFEPSIATRVPLWLALALKKVRRCKIIPPKWLQVRAVESVVQYEQEHEGSLHPLPFFFHQISALLLQHAEDDLELPHQLRRAMEDLSSVRAGKMRRWMQMSVRERVHAVKVNNLTSLEIEVHRPVLSRVLEGLYAMHAPELDADMLTQSASTGTTFTGNDRTSGEGQRGQVRRIIRRT